MAGKSAVRLSMENKLPEIKIEKGIPLPEPGRKNPVIPYFQQAIAGMEIGDSFVISGPYSIGDCAMAAFRAKGWKGAKRQVTKSKNHVWTFRLWRVA